MTTSPFAGERVVTRLAVRSIRGDLGRNLIVLALIAVGAATAIVAAAVARSGTSSGDGTIASEATVYGLMIAIAPLALMAVLASAAMVTATRRHLHDVGLLLVNGATVAHVRGVVLRQATFLGLAGSAIGAAVGLALVAPAVRIAGDLWGGQRATTVLWLDIVATVAIGTLATIAGAWVPASLVGHIPATAALAGRAPRPVTKRNPVRGGLAALAMAAFFAIDPVTAPGAGSALLIALVMLAAPLLVRLGAWAHRLPLLPRLVVRDAARQRTRSGAVVAALIVTLALATVSAATQASEARFDARYRPDDRATIVLTSGDPVQTVTAGEFLPPSVATATVQTYDLVDDAIVLPPEPGDGPAGNQFTQVAVVDAATLELLGVDTGPLATERTVYRLRSWQSRLFRSDEPVATPVAPGRISLRENPTVSTEADIITLDATRHPGEPIPNLFVTPDLLELLRLRTGGSFEVQRLERAPTEAEVRTFSRAVVIDLDPRMRASIQSIADEFGVDAAHSVLGSGQMAVYAPPRDPTAAILLISGAAAALALLIAALAAALAATESDRDLDTIATLGSRPALRRRFHGLLATYHVGLAAVLAVPSTLLILAAIDRGSPSQRFDEAYWRLATALPWTYFAMIALVPLAAGLLVAATSRRSRLDITRRPT